MKTSPPNKAVPAGRGGKIRFGRTIRRERRELCGIYAMQSMIFSEKGFSDGLFRHQDEEQAQAVEGLAFRPVQTGECLFGEGQVLVVEHEFHTFGFAVDLAVVKADEVDGVADAGAAFAISPGLHKALAKAGDKANIPLIPGVATPSEVQLALEYGMETLKLFPAEVVGGTAMLKALYGPYANVRFCPTGGITLQSAPEYLALPNVLCVGGSWLTPKDAVANKDWDTITQLAKEAAALKG